MFINKKCISRNTLKLIAIAAMTIDHIAWAVYPGYSTEPLAVIMHLIGRITCPIMCFFIAEGYHYTSNVKKYFVRLLLFALVSHIPYMLCSANYAKYGLPALIPFAVGNGFGEKFLNQTDVLFSLAAGLAMLYVNERKKLPLAAKVGLVILFCILSFPADWSCIAALFVLSIGSNRENPKKQFLWCLFYLTLYAAVYFFSLSKVYGLIQFGALLAVPVIAMYNPELGGVNHGKFAKWSFYVYYPLHLFVIWLVKNLFILYIVLKYM